jgi:hypothetical protein
MTGYLQRLAASAAKIERSIHPIVPPIFSAPAAVDGGGDHPSLEEFSVARAADAPPPSIARPAEQRRQTILAGAPSPVAAAIAAPEPGAQSSSPPLVYPHAAVAAAPIGRDGSPPLVDQQRRGNPGKIGQRDAEPEGAEADAIRVRGPPRPPPDLTARAEANEDRCRRASRNRACPLRAHFRAAAGGRPRRAGPEYSRSCTSAPTARIDQRRPGPGCTSSSSANIDQPGAARAERRHEGKRAERGPDPYRPDRGDRGSSGSGASVSRRTAAQRHVA